MPSLEIAIEQWPPKASFCIAGYEFTRSDLIVVTPEEGGYTGTEEAAVVYYRNETPESMRDHIEAVRDEIERGIDRNALGELLPCNGPTEALMMVKAIRAADMRPLVGCMEGTSLSMIPGCLVDGAMFLPNDRATSITCRDGRIVCPVDGWGMP